MSWGWGRKKFNIHQRISHKLLTSYWRQRKDSTVGRSVISINVSGFIKYGIPKFQPDMICCETECSKSKERRNASDGCGGTMHCTCSRCLVNTCWIFSFVYPTKCFNIWIHQSCNLSRNYIDFFPPFIIASKWSYCRTIAAKLNV